jgi:mRNA-degrading endonuclease RelE of RelBE toxin-antitoxin system
MSWSLRFAPSVEKDLRKIERSDARFILDTLERLARDYNDAMRPNS